MWNALPSFSHVTHTLTNRYFFRFSLQCDSEGDDDKVRDSRNSSQILRENHSNQPFQNPLVTPNVNDWILFQFFFHFESFEIRSEFMQIKYKFQQLKKATECETTIFYWIKKYSLFEC